MATETGMDFFMFEVLGSLVQLPAYALMIGLPAWLLIRWHRKKKTYALKKEST